MHKMICCLLLVLFSTVASAGEITFAEVETFLQEMKSETIPLPGRAPLFNHYYRSKKMLPTALVFLPGMGESALKYYDLGRDLRDFPATLYMWDHIGHGLSSHLIPEEKDKIHIDSFETHINALENFFTELKKKHSTIYVLGHSMGGHLAIRVAIRHPELIQKMVLSSPLIEINQETLPLHWVEWLLEYLPGNSYPPLQFLYKHNASNGSYVTKSEERLKVLEQMVAKYPDIKREGATIGWIRAAIHSIADLKKEDPSKITAPVFIMQAEKDYLVSVPAQTEICKKMPHCQTEVIPGSYHELFFEKDPARAKALKDMRAFFTESGSLKKAN